MSVEVPRCQALQLGTEQVNQTLGGLAIAVQERPHQRLNGGCAEELTAIVCSRQGCLNIRLGDNRVFLQGYLPDHAD